MTLADVMARHQGYWENDTARVKLGAYWVRIAVKLNGDELITEDGVREFPELDASGVPDETPVADSGAPDEVTDDTAAVPKKAKRKR